MRISLFHLFIVIEKRQHELPLFILCKQYVGGNKAGEQAQMMVTGHPGGHIILWSGLTPLSSNGSHDGRDVTQLCSIRERLFSGGGDGTVRSWLVTKGLLQRDLAGGASLPEYKRAGGALRIKSLDIDTNVEHALVSTDEVDLWELSLGNKDKSEYDGVPLVRGHKGKVYGIAWNASRPSLLAVASNDSRVVLYDAEQGISLGYARLGTMKQRSLGR